MDLSDYQWELDGGDHVETANHYEHHSRFDGDETNHIGWSSTGTTNGEIRDTYDANTRTWSPASGEITSKLVDTVFSKWSDSDPCSDMLFGQTAIGMRFNSGSTKSTVTRNTTTSVTGGVRATTGEGTDESSYSATAGYSLVSTAMTTMLGFVPVPVACYSESENKDSTGKINYAYNETTGWQATGGTGTNGGGRSWGFYYWPKEVVSPIYTGTGSENNPLDYQMPDYLQGTGTRSESMSGGYADSYSGTTTYNASSDTWLLTEGSGKGSGSVRSSMSSSVDATAYVGFYLESLPAANYGGSSTYAKHYATGAYTSSDATSEYTNFKASFSAENGEWKAIFEGTDHEDTLVKYGMEAAGELALNSDWTGKRRKIVSGSETVSTQYKADWNTASGTKQVTSFKNDYRLTRSIDESSHLDAHHVHVQDGVTYTQDSLSETSRSVELTIHDVTETGASRIYENTAHLTFSFLSEITTSHGYSSTAPGWCHSEMTQNAQMSKADPSATYAVTNTTTDNLFYANLYNSEPIHSNSETTSYCNLSFSGSGINTHYSHGGTSQVSGIALTFGDNGASISFGGSTVIPSGFSSDNFDDFIPKPPAPPPLDMSSAFAPMSNMDWALGTAYNIAATPEGRHVALDVAGMAPFVGGAADALNAGLYACEGDYANAALSGAAIVFDGIGIAKLAGRVTKGVSKATNKLSDAASTMRHHAGECLDGVHCFTEGTQIVVGLGLAEDGTVLYDTKSIEDIEVGDLVYSYNTITGEYEYSEVTSTMALTSKHVCCLTIEDENGNEQTIETTDAHPFWVVSDEPDLSRAAGEYVNENGVWLYHENMTPTDAGYWVEAKDLRVGDTFLGADGKLSTLTNKVRVEQDGGIAVFNFTVEGNHNYFILAKDFAYGQSCVLVHNALTCSQHADLLRKSMKNAGQRIDDLQPHHIVPSGHPAAEQAREILTRNGIDLDSFMNGVGLTRRQHQQQGLARVNYIENLTKRLLDAESQRGPMGVRIELRTIANELSNF